MITTILSFLVVIMILVMAHEIGHLVAAKKLGVRVEKFSIGFGPRIAGIKKGDTQYVIGLVPLGGYVQLGEESAGSNFDPHSPAYAERPPLHKIIIALAGPCANFALAIIVFTIVSILGVSSPAYMERPADVGWVGAGSPAAKAGHQPGDRIIEINGSKVGTWNDMISSIPLYEKGELLIKYEREGKARWSRLTHVSRLNCGFSPVDKVTISAVSKDSPAAHAGLLPGDVITTIGEKHISSWAQFQQIISRSKNSVAIGFTRNGGEAFTYLTPRLDGTGKGYAGVSYVPKHMTIRFTAASAAINGFTMAKTTVFDTLQTFWALITGDISIKALGGPVAIAQASGSTAKAGLVPLFAFLAFMSIQLGVFNLMPFIPIVDGGQVTLFVYELLRRRPIGFLSLERFAKAGWAFMGVLFLFVTYNDVLRLL